MIGEIISLIPEIVGLFSSNSAHDEYGAELQKIKEQQKVSEAARRAEGIYASMSNQGLAGYETMKQDIRSTLPETLGATKDWLTSGQAVDYIARASANADKQIRNLNAVNENQLMSNRNQYAQFLGNDMARYENKALDDQSQMGVNIAYNDLLRKGDLSQNLGTVINKTGSILDKDWSKIIALLSGGDNSMTYQGSLKPSSPLDTRSEGWTL